MLKIVPEEQFNRILGNMTDYVIEEDTEHLSVKFVSYFQHDKRFAQSITVKTGTVYLVDQTLC